MTLPFKLGKKSIEVPTGWNDMTVKQWNKLKEADPKDITSCLSVLFGVTREEIANSSLLDLDVKIMPILKWVKKAPDLQKLKMKDKLRIGSTVYDVPKELAIKTFAQKILFQEKLIEFMDERGNIKTEAIAEMIAIYMYPEKEFDDLKALAFAEQVEQCNFFECYPIACFFLKSFLKFLNKTNNSLQKTTPPNNSEQA